jgi:predicted DNA-binding transcriptional regulator AlpA
LSIRSILIFHKVLLTKHRAERGEEAFFMTPNFRFIPKRELCSMLGISRASLERGVAEGRIPRPYKLGLRTVRWRSDEIERYLNELPCMDDAYSGQGGQK